MRISSLITTSKEKFKNMPVKKKVTGVFKSIMVRVSLVIAFLLVTVGIALIGLRNTYERHLAADNLQGEIRIDIQALSKHFLWALSSPDEGIRATELTKINEAFDDFDAYEAKLGTLYDNKKMIEQFYAHLKVVKDDGKTLEAMFTDGRSTNDDIFYYHNDTVYPAINDVASDLKTVSSEIAASAQAEYHLALIVTGITLILSLAIIVTTILYLLNVSRNLAASITEPVNAVNKAADDMARGILNINIDYEADDELGSLARDLQKSTQTISDIVNDISATLSRMSTGDFSTGSRNPELYIGDYKEINDAFEDIASQLSSTLTQVREASEQVSQGASNMSEGATALAEGATDQAAAIQQLTASVTNVTQQTREVADAAEQSNEMAQTVKSEVDTAARKMHLVTDAMNRITDASKEIEIVTNTIESIAKQTSLLALNASIEAARAGESGKGFAVVASQISQLANQSSEAAKNTHQLISDTMDEISNGNAVVDETKASLELVVESVNEVSEMMMTSGNMAENQVLSMEQISDGIEQISNVVQSNSATAQESSAVSQELSNESNNLNNLIEKFQVM